MSKWNPEHWKRYSNDELQDLLRKSLGIKSETAAKREVIKADHPAKFANSLLTAKGKYFCEICGCWGNIQHDHAEEEEDF